jgi:hypothetical protein
VRKFAKELASAVVSMGLLFGMAVFPSMVPELAMALGLLVLVGLLGFLVLYPILRAMEMDE